MKRIIAFIVIILVILNTADAATRSKERLRKDFNKLKFGMFIHFNMGTFHEKEWVEPGITQGLRLQKCGFFPLRRAVER